MINFARDKADFVRNSQISRRGVSIHQRQINLTLRGKTLRSNFACEQQHAAINRLICGNVSVLANCSSDDYTFHAMIFKLLLSTPSNFYRLHRVALPCFFILWRMTRSWACIFPQTIAREGLSLSAGNLRVVHLSREEAHGIAEHSQVFANVAFFQHQC